MPYFNKDNIKLHYTDSQITHPDAKTKATIITTHGMSESHLYWSISGITEHLIKAGYRVINTDMRGHGFTEVNQADKGYDVNSLVQDILDLADHLNLDTFHLLTHATGGIVGFHLGFEHSNRLLSIMATNTGSATFPSNEYAKLTDPDANIPPLSESDAQGNIGLAKTFKGKSKGDLMVAARKYASKSPFLCNMPNLEHAEMAFAQYAACSYVGDPNNIAEFVETFYSSYDPHIKGLRQIQCPTLMLVGEYDHLFIEAAKLIKREVPNCEHVTMQGIGHMTALEAPTELSEILIGFLNHHETKAA